MCIFSQLIIVTWNIYVIPLKIPCIPKFTIAIQNSNSGTDAYTWEYILCINKVIVTDCSKDRNFVPISIVH